MSETEHKVEGQEASVTITDKDEVTQEGEGGPYRTFASKDELDKFLEVQTGRAVKAVKTTEREAADKQAEEERQKREEALKEQEDWKTLAKEHADTITTREARIAELEQAETERQAAKERTTALEERLKGLIKPQLEAVPELYRPFVESMGVEEQAEWLSENAEKLGTQNGAGRPAGSRPTGRAQQVPKTETDKEARERQRQARVSAI